jgi:hypothetical protein
MPAPALDDLFSLDRDVARAAAALTKGESVDRWRHVAGQTTYEGLAHLAPSLVDAPLRDALRRWVYALLQGRLAAPIDEELAEAETEASAPITVPEPRRVSWREAWRGVVASETPLERGAWLGAAVERAPDVAAVVHRRAERRHEIARRLGMEHADAPFAPSLAPIHAAAEALLVGTDDLAAQLLRDARVKQGLPAGSAVRGGAPGAGPVATDALAIAVGRDAPEGWPARLQWRWLESLFGEYLRGLRVAPVRLVLPLGAATFARACAAFGVAFRVAGASPSLPFSLARDPWFVGAHRFGAVFGALPASAAFQRRALGNVARVAEGQARVVARTALLAARLDAARVLLASAPRDRFEELTARLYGAPLPAALGGAWPRSRDDEAARFVGLVTAADLARELVDRFDEDWFANPRAVLHLRAIASAPAFEPPPDDLTPNAGRLARAFEEALA